VNDVPVTIREAVFEILRRETSPFAAASPKCHGSPQPAWSRGATCLNATLLQRLVEGESASRNLVDASVSPRIRGGGERR
jgi:hypothetical protein